MTTANVLDKYGYYPTTEDVNATLEKIMAYGRSLCTCDNYVKCLRSIDLTTLDITDTQESVTLFTNKVNGFQDWVQKSLNMKLPNVAAICVYPALVPVVKETLHSPAIHSHSVKIAAVSGGFPASQTFLEVKLKEAEMTLASGADELDIVLPLRALLSDNCEEVAQEIRATRELIYNSGKECSLKVILESGALSSPELIAKASFLALENGADFIKTSTGKWKVGATPEAAVVMCECIKRFHAVTGKMAGFKAAGGIRKAQDAILYMAIAQHILGEGFIDKQHFRIGASSLANALLTEVAGCEVSYF